jgi:hypothetical protein
MLESKIDRLLLLLERHPKIAQRANFYEVTTPAVEVWRQRAQQELNDVGLDEFHEYPISPYVVLYAASDAHVLVISIGHERQLGYGSIG